MDSKEDSELGRGGGDGDGGEGGLINDDFSSGVVISPLPHSIASWSSVTAICDDDADHRSSPRNDHPRVAPYRRPLDPPTTATQPSSSRNLDIRAPQGDVVRGGGGSSCSHCRPPRRKTTTFVRDGRAPRRLHSRRGGGGEDNHFVRPNPPETISTPHFDDIPPPRPSSGAGGERHGGEEEQWEEVEEDEAPPPPEIIAASYEAIGKSNREMKTNPHDSIEDDGEAGLMGPSLGVFHGDGTPANMDITGGRSDPPPSTSAILQVQVSPTPRSDDDGQRLPRSGRAHVGMALPPTPEPMPPSRPILDRNNQSLPLFEATCVDDVVYEAFPMPRTPQKYRVIIAGLIVVATAAIIAVIVVVVRGQSEWNDGSYDDTDSFPTNPTVTGSATNVSLDNVTTTISPPITQSPKASQPAGSPTVSPSTAAPSASPTTDIPTKAPEAFISSASIWVQYGPAIDGDAEDDLLGSSVAVSADASIIVIGAPGIRNGYVQVYRTNDDSGNRVQLGQTIFEDATGDQFGWSVDITADGNTIVIGAPGYYVADDRPGYVRVFTLESDDDLGTNTWKPIGQYITGEVDGDEFGYSVSISEDGNIIAVGARSADGSNGVDSGRVRVYRMDVSQSDWIPIGNYIEGEADGDNSGTSISLSADGTKVAIGTPLNDEYGDSTGYVKVYQMYSAGSSWEQLGQILYGDDALDYSGYSVDLSPDGNTLAIGSPGDGEDDSRPGYVRVYSLKVSDNDHPATGSWEKIGLDIIGEAEGDQFGRSVSLSNDGRKIAIGGNFNDGVNGVISGHVRVYRKVDSQTDWIQIGGDVDGEAAGDYSGWSLSLSADGYKVAIGSPYYDDDIDDGAGHVRVYALE